jgi:hypothetical protein
MSKYSQSIHQWRKRSKNGTRKKKSFRDIELFVSLLKRRKKDRDRTRHITVSIH